MNGIFKSGLIPFVGKSQSLTLCRHFVNNKPIYGISADDTGCLVIQKTEFPEFFIKYGIFLMCVYLYYNINVICWSDFFSFTIDI